VVVPFQNLSSDSSADWIGGGIAATIVTDFGRRNQMSAIRFNPLDAEADQSRWWASSFDNSDAVDAARRLGAKWVITGGYQLLDEKIRITSLLVDLEAETVGATVKVDGSVLDLFTLQDRVSAELMAGALFSFTANELREEPVERLPRPDRRRRNSGGALGSRRGTAPESPVPTANELREEPIERLPRPDRRRRNSGGALGSRRGTAPESPVPTANELREEPVERLPRPDRRRRNSGGTLGAGSGRGLESALEDRSDQLHGSQRLDLETENSEKQGDGDDAGLGFRNRRIEGPLAGRLLESELLFDSPDAQIINEEETVSNNFLLDRTVPEVGVATDAGILTGRPTVRPLRTELGPIVDGRLDDAIWQSASRIAEFVQRNPVEGEPATEQTDVYIAYDSQNIYFAFYAHYSDPSMMRANRVDRDQSFSDDTISVYFDPFLDQQRAYVFSVNGYGVQMDSIMNSRGGFSGGYSGVPRGDRSWDVLFESGGRIVEDGFTAEIAVPFKSLRYPQREPGMPHRWGFQIARSIRGKDETVVWSRYSRAISGFLPQMGLIEGMTNLSTSRNFEVMPTFTGIRFGSLDSAGRFNEMTDPEAGVNLKYGLTSNLTADVAFNPDFSQIESDRPQIEVNQRFPLFYSELRPFFLEGAEIFEMSGPVTFVHTRTIVDPDFGGKITGKVGKTTLGLLVANDAAPGNVESSDDPLFGKNANVLIGRARYDLYAESFLGAIFTNRDFLDSYSRLGGVDGNFRLGQTQSLGFLAVQTEHLDLDRIRSSGQMFDVNYRINGRNISGYVSAYTLSPGFKTNVGFIRRVDQKRVNGSIGYRWWPESWVINWGPRFNYGSNWNFDNVLEDTNARFGLRASFAKNLRFSFDITRDMERYRGISFDKRGYSLNGGVNTSRRYSFGGYYRYGDLIRYADNPFLGQGSNGSIYMTLRPASRFQSRINIGTSRLVDPRNADELVFDVKIYRVLTTYQMTDRLLFRNIAEYNTYQRTVGLNVLGTYRVNAGTVFYIGYDDHYQQGNLYDDELFPEELTLRQTNRAFFTKLQYLFRN